MKLASSKHALAFKFVCASVQMKSGHRNVRKVEARWNLVVLDNKWKYCLWTCWCWARGLAIQRNFLHQLPPLSINYVHWYVNTLLLANIESFLFFSATLASQRYMISLEFVLSIELIEFCVDSKRKEMQFDGFLRDGTSLGLSNSRVCAWDLQNASHP